MEGKGGWVLMKKCFAVVGEDARQKAAGEYLAAQGFRVVGAERVYEADYILLPLPLDADRVGLARLLRAARPGAVALGGRVSPQVMATGQSAGVPILDYFRRPELAERNAVPTAEGCIGLLLEKRQRVLQGSAILVTGYGRVGRALALRLGALGALVTVAVRSPGACAQAEADGHKSLALRELCRKAAAFDCAVNTIPAQVFTRAVLEAMPERSLIIDLASLPGGVDDAAAGHCGVTVLHALSLPARCAPVTAGELVGRTVLTMLREREEGEEC